MADGDRPGEVNRPIKYKLGEKLDASQVRTTTHDLAEDQQSVRRITKLGETLTNALQNRVSNPAGTGRTMKVSWEEYMTLRDDPGFQSLSKYVTNLLFYADGVTPRPRPLRPLIQNEVGRFIGGPFDGKIIYLKDAGPGDYGEGKYYVIGAGTEPTLLGVQDASVPEGAELTEDQTREAIGLEAKVPEEAPPPPIAEASEDEEPTGEKVITFTKLCEIINPILDTGGIANMVEIRLDPGETISEKAFAHAKKVGVHIFDVVGRQMC